MRGHTLSPHRLLHRPQVLPPRRPPQWQRLQGRKPRNQCPGVRPRLSGVVAQAQMGEGHQLGPRWGEERKVRGAEPEGEGGEGGREARLEQLLQGA